MNSEIIEPPTDLRTRNIVEKAASFVSKNGLEFESKIMPHDVRFNFLRSSADPCHAYYKHKLAEYSASQKQEKQEDDDDDLDDDTAVIDPPPNVTTLTIVKRMAFLVSEKGLEFERMVASRNKDDARFNFLWSTFDPYRDTYQHRLSGYRIKKRKGDLTTSEFLEAELAKQQADVVQSELKFKRQLLSLPNFLQCRLLKGMTIKERDIVKVTALFASWYGVDFLVGSRVMNNCEFEFMKASDRRFSLFNEFLIAYTKVLEPLPESLKDKMRKDEAYKTTILDGFFYRIQSDVLAEETWQLVGEKLIIDWHDSVVKEFANKENQELKPPEEPDSKRQKFGESALVEED